MERTVADRLNELMEAHPIYRGRGGQTALAKKTGVPQPTINRILSKKSEGELGTISRLAVEFEVTVEWLLTERGPKYIAELGADAGPEPSTERRPLFFATPETPAYVMDALTTMWAAHGEGTPREAFDAVRTLFNLLRKPEAGKIAARQQDDGAGRPAAKIDSVVAKAQEVMRDATRDVAPRSEGNRATQVSGAKRSKNTRH